MYIQDYGSKATLSQPEYGVPKQFDYDKLYPDYLRKNCNGIKENYWVDSNGIVQGSVIKPPKVNELSGTSLTWENSLNAVSYNVYKDVNGKQVIFKENAVSPVDVETGGFYFVSAVDRYNFETPAVSSKYDPSKDVKNCTTKGTTPNNPDGDNDGGNDGLEVGDYLVIGEYKGNPIEWVVLEKNATGLYLFNVLTINDEFTERKLDDDLDEANWINSDLRQFLNNEFYNEAFNSYQKSIILEHTYKNYVGTEDLSEGGEERLEYEFNNFESVVESNVNDAWYNHTTDKITLPSVTDAYRTHILRYILNLDAKGYRYTNFVYTRDSYLDSLKYFLNKYHNNYDTSIVGHYINTNTEAFVRPAMYIKSDAVPTKGNGTLDNPYLFEQTYTGKPYKTLIKEYEDIVVTNDMFPEYMDDYSNRSINYIKTIKMEIPEELKGERLLLTLTLEKKAPAQFVILTRTSEQDKVENIKIFSDIYDYDMLQLVGTSSSQMNLFQNIEDNKYSYDENEEFGTFDFYYEYEIWFDELDLYVWREVDEPNEITIKNIKVEKLNYK